MKTKVSLLKRIGLGAVVHSAWGWAIVGMLLGQFAIRDWHHQQTELARQGEAQAAMVRSYPVLRNYLSALSLVVLYPSEESQVELQLADQQLETLVTLSADYPLPEGEVDVLEKATERLRQLAEELRMASPDGPTAQVKVAQIRDFEKLLFADLQSRCDASLAEITRLRENLARAYPVALGAAVVLLIACLVSVRRASRFGKKLLRLQALFQRQRNRKPFEPKAAPSLDDFFLGGADEPPADEPTAPLSEDQQLMQEFRDKLLGHLQQIEEGIAEEDLPKVSEASEWLMSAAGTFGFDSFTEPARMMMQAANESELDQVIQLLSQLHALTQEMSLDRGPMSVTQA